MELQFNNNNDFILLFEQKLCEFTGAKFCVLTDSCSNALFLSLKYFKEKNNISNMKIEMPNRTYISVYNSVFNAGFSPILTDIKWEENYELSNTKIYDCAVGFKKNMYKPNTFMCLSFQQKKALKIGKGGAILLDDEEAYTYLKRLCWDGRDSSIPLKHDKPLNVGFHMNMIPDDAAKGVLLLNQLTNEEIDKNLLSYKNYVELSNFLIK